MKYIISLCLTAICFVADAQTPTVISPSTTIETFSALTAGRYRFFGSVTKDTVDLSIDKTLVCPVCPTCPAPIVCPVCPVCPGPVVSVTINKTGQAIFTYQNGSTTTLTLKNNVLIQ
jgi:hypothetical protein